MKFITTLFSILLCCFTLHSSAGVVVSEPADTAVITGAERINKVVAAIHGKRVGLVANQTSLVGTTHLVDTLLSLGVHIVKVFAPEHGFRGEAGPGDAIGSGTDTKTGLPMVSLYGSRKKPTAADLQDIDVVIFDIQDVGARFYTYISTLQYLMDACAENRKKLIVLDRPNPNGFYVDGPVLDTAYKSFVGAAPIPVVHGLTVGEYAKMAKGEGWAAAGGHLKLKVIKMKNYTHSTHYELPVPPSPNLPNYESVILYPALCLFEGTKVSVGRGTDRPFQLIGFPGLTPFDTTFCPADIKGVITDPPYNGVECNGRLLTGYGALFEASGQLNLSLLLEMYQSYPRQSIFFTSFFDRLAGTDSLRKQIIAGWSEEQIRAGWEPSLGDYRKERKKYLLYEDFPGR
ncbi:MAG TPA: DUF1343 domain-containing protein [Bacteroidia bacterium]|nr:DUF1343 domain-containing protein [Bacteroidia bacterium]